MSAIALQTTAPGIWRRFARSCVRLVLAVFEGIEAAHRYRRLSVMSDAELARLGIAREDAAWFALCGERPPPCPRVTAEQPPAAAAGTARKAA